MTRRLVVKPLKTPEGARPGVPPPRPESDLARGPRSARGGAKNLARKNAIEDKTTEALEKPYEPAPYERMALQAYLAQTKEKPLSPRIKVTEKNGMTTLAPDHPKPSIAHVLLLEALGSRDFDFLSGLLKQLCDVIAHGRSTDEDGLNFMLSVVKGIEPHDQLEAMLAAQMAVTHDAVMTFARRLKHVENIPQQDSTERAFNKLARTFAVQVETLKRYRSEGGQTVRVEHVTVNDGGQAIVGNVTNGGRDSSGKTEPSP